MTASASLTAAVQNGIIGARKPGPFGFLRNFNGAADEAGVAEAGDANLLFYDSVAIASGATANLDLTDFGVVHAIYVKVTSVGTGVLSIGGAATTAFVGPFAANKVALGAGDELYVSNPEGWAVTNILNLLGISCATAAMTYDIVVVGLED
jgi:hypothetical protein